MVQPIVMPKLGQSEEEAKIVRWLKKEGDPVNKGDILFEIETDKALLEVESFFEGTLLKVVASEGEVAPVQSTVAYLGAPGEAVPEGQPSPPSPAKTGVPTISQQGWRDDQAAPPVEGSRVRPEIAEQKSLKNPVAEPPALRSETHAAPVFRISPRAARLAREAAIDAAPVVGTGPGGRVIERDVAAYLQSKGYDRLRITPAAKALAASKKIDLLSLESRDARITVGDVQRAIAELPRPMPRMRQIIADRLTRSFTSTPHFFVTVSVDMTELLELRSELKNLGKPYTVTDFVLKSVAITLADFPLVNSTTDGINFVEHSRINLGLAVSLDQGLLVPVIRDAGDLTLEEIHLRVAELTEKARAGKLTPAEMAGSTFTISNMGMLDVENFTAIINPGESAILAVSSILKQPAVKGDQVVIRSIMKITLSSDHRLIDGALAARFLNSVKSKLEEKILWKRLA